MLPVRRKRKLVSQQLVDLRGISDRLLANVLEKVKRHKITEAPTPRSVYRLRKAEYEPAATTLKVPCIKKSAILLGISAGLIASDKHWQTIA